MVFVDVDKIVLVQMDSQSERFMFSIEMVLKKANPALDGVSKAAREHHGRCYVGATIPPFMGHMYKKQAIVIPKWLGG